MRIARVYYPVTILGPGKRIGIWTAGCPRCCPGCLSPELQSEHAGRECTVAEVLAMTDRVQAQVDGVTVSGGEPFADPAALSALLWELRRRYDDILVYTGYTYGELKAMNDPDVDSAIRACSVLIDGPYLAEQNDGRGLRGSANQTVHIFRNHEKYDNPETCRRSLQTVVYGNRVLSVGIP